VGAIISIILTGCGADIFHSNHNLRFDGVWVDEYIVTFSLDPGFFWFDSTFLRFDSGSYSPPDSVWTQYFIDANTGDTINIYGQEFLSLYDIELPVTSILSFNADQFNLKINGGEVLEKEISGHFEIIADTAIFNIENSYYRYLDYFNIPYDPEISYSKSMMYHFCSSDSLQLTSLFYPSDTGRITVELVGFVWSLPSLPLLHKNSGVFIRQ
jgi:hypothetical protein